ncbi:metal ABC transporter ATP-binding protein [Pseudodesulfovibrio piezophilus]|uniref:ABC transporter related n=1 Tax=Pseudodesulfovibrio piezophilus (strain DSM 21447 / JCM 15486 / C1TLV30) TaxID=1322246 RepID=M1WN54_PSEP2|nr:metal ABC transporter ATP-binding protein [Pseudodesulfovibrio piezophilus]CCH50175.1 ABC transporter related [Pseudodesulfovibrio piezophilus C1TLV30]
MTVTHMTGGPSVHFENVGLSLGGNTILDGVNFTVAAGTIHCVIGPNGGGKTSLIRSLLGQMPHTGDIRICWGNDWTMGYVPQALEFDDSLPMTVADFMAMIGQRHRPAFMGLKRDSRTLVENVLARVDMLDKRDRPFGSLSGGERQRVLLAQALMPSPKLLVLDEPASGLDKAGAAVMHSIVQELSDNGTTVLIIHHDLGIVREIAHGVTCINQHMLFSGDPQQELTSERIFTIFSSSAKAA